MLVYSSVERKLTIYARVVELVDSLDSGSSAHSGHAGSSPASRTIRDSRKAVSFFVRLGSLKGAKPLCFQQKWRHRGILLSVFHFSICLQVFLPVLVGVDGDRSAEGIKRLDASNLSVNIYHSLSLIVLRYQVFLF